MNPTHNSPRDNGNSIIPILMVVSTMGLVLGVTSWRWSWPIVFPSSEREVVTLRLSESPLTRQVGLSVSFAPVVSRVASSVVYVYSTRMVKSPYGAGLRPLLDDPWFKRFFGDRPDEVSPHHEPRMQKQQSLGSGVIVSQDGHILTNNHIIDGADEVKIGLLGDQREFVAKVVGRDAKTDLAVLKIDAGDLPPVTLAESSKVAVGDVVLAIGNPFGIGQTVTMGIVSATQRGGMGIEEYEDFIQTDAAINPGNSGGALVDTEGRLVGICTAILSRSGANQGVGFAVPADLARGVMKQILTKGHVVRGYLGVSIQDVTPELRKDFPVPQGHGALVGGVADGSAADLAGLKNGDVIVTFKGDPVVDSRTLKLRVGETSPGEKVELKVLRDGQEKSFTITLQEMPDHPDNDDSNRADHDANNSLHGVTLSEIDEVARREHGLPAALKGALVAEMDEDSVAFEAGLRVGNVIQEINHQAVTRPEDAAVAMQKTGGKRLVLRIWSQGGSRYLVVGKD